LIESPKGHEAGEGIIFQVYNDMEIFIIGAGTLGRFVIDIVESDNQFEI
jgi:hypothetical protein